MQAFYSPVQAGIFKTTPKQFGFGEGVAVNKFARFNGTTDAAAIPAFTLPSSEATVIIRCRLRDATPDNYNLGGLAALADGVDHTYYPTLDGLAYCNFFRTTRVDGITLNGAITLTAWHWVVCRTNAGSGWQFLQASDAGTLYSCATAAHQAFNPTIAGGVIGGNEYGSIFFDGDMDRFLLFPTRMADAAIQAVIAGGNGTSPVVRYEFSSVADDVFTDESGNDLHADISGSPTIITA